MRFLVLFIVMIVGGGAVAWYSSQSLPSWYQPESDQQQQLVDNLSQQISQQGVSNFLDKKVSGVLNGQLELSENEFNALLLASLKSSEDGRKLLSVSDAINVQLEDEELQLGVVVDLNKIAGLDAKAKDAVNRLEELLPFLNNAKLSLGVRGKPVARDGEIGFADNFSVRIGALPISSSLLEQLGVSTHKVSQATLPIKHIKVKSINIEPDKIMLGVTPQF